MVEIKRQSPVRFGVGAQRTEMRDNWTVVLEYRNEGEGPWLVDLSHKTRWDLQDSAITAQSPAGLPVPETPGACTFENGTLVNRMNRTQASIWHLGNETPELPDFSGHTDVTESTVFLALFGPATFFIAEKLSALDFMDPDRKPPFLLQGPLSHVPCQIVTLQRGPAQSGCLLMTCSRGYGDSMIHAVLDSGTEFGLRPAGELKFTDWLSAATSS